MDVRRQLSRSRRVMERIGLVAGRKVRPSAAGRQPHPAPRGLPFGGVSAAHVPPGWPAGVHPPGTEGFERTAVAFLLDQCPAEYRGHDLLRRQPAVLARFAAHHVAGAIEAAREGYRQARTELSAPSVRRSSRRPCRSTRSKAPGWSGRSPGRPRRAGPARQRSSPASDRPLREPARGARRRGQRAPSRCSIASWSRRSKAMPRSASASGSNVSARSVAEGLARARVGHGELVHPGGASAACTSGSARNGLRLLAQDQVVAHAAARPTPTRPSMSSVRGGL